MSKPDKDWRVGLKLLAKNIKIFNKGKSDCPMCGMNPLITIKATEQTLNQQRKEIREIVVSTYF